MITLDSKLAQWLRPHAERTAAPQPDREPGKRGVAPVAESEPEKATALDLDAYAPEAVETWRRIEQLPEQQAGTMALPVGVRPDGKRQPGSEDAFYREPHPLPSRDHDDDQIVINGTLHFQTPPPVHVKGDHPGSSKVRARVKRELSEAEAQRRVLEMGLGPIAAEAREMDKADLAALVGMNPARLARKMPRGR